MAQDTRVRRKTRRKSRRRRPAAPVPEAEAAEYVFDVIRSLIGITQDYDRFRLAAWFLEMAALEIAPRMRPGAGNDRPLSH